MPNIAKVAGLDCQYDYECLDGNEKGWESVSVGGGQVHVHPINDWQPHIFSQACHCVPRMIFAGAGIVWSHNSFDARESYEKLEGWKSGSLNL